MIQRVCLGYDEKFSLFEFLAFFFVLFIDLIALFGIILRSHYTIQLTFNFFFPILSAKSFQFQLK